ncbi:MAG TPA: MDR family MFS transporter [Aeromicrobium sp.]|nr:MDR family MFS transporter [Aeromicrobium sp.]
MTDAPAITVDEAAAASAAKMKADYGVVAWLVAATFVVILNETIMMNAIPRLMGEFAVDARAAQWLSTAFMLTMAVVIPVTGWFLQRVTTRQAYGLAMIVFSVGTAIAAVAPVFWLLIAGRIVQAAGTAVMMPLLMTTLMEVVPEHDRGRIMGRVVMAISVAPALGPAVSGVVLQFTSWRWLFGFVLPISLGMLVAGLRRLTNVGEVRVHSVDISSIVISALGFGTAVYGLSLVGGPSVALDLFGRHVSVHPLWFVGAGSIVVALFVWRQVILQRIDNPLLDLRTLRHSTFTLGLLLMAVAFMGFMGSMIVLPIYLQELRGLTSLETGLLMIPGGLAMGLSGPRIGRFFDEFGARPLIVPGAIAVTAALGALTQVDATTPIAVILTAHVFFMAGLAALFTPIFTLSLNSVPEHLYSHASSLLGTTQQVAGAIGTAVVVTVMSWRAATLSHDGATAAQAAIGGTQWAFITGALLSIGIIVLALVIPSRAPEGMGGHAH